MAHSFWLSTIGHISSSLRSWGYPLTRTPLVLVDCSSFVRCMLLLFDLWSICWSSRTLSPTRTQSSAPSIAPHCPSIARLGIEVCTTRALLLILFLLAHRLQRSLDTPPTPRRAHSLLGLRGRCLAFDCVCGGYSFSIVILDSHPSRFCPRAVPLSSHLCTPLCVLSLSDCPSFCRQGSALAAACSSSQPVLPHGGPYLLLS